MASLRNLPSVDSLLALPETGALADLFGRALTVDAIREALAAIRLAHREGRGGGRARRSLDLARQGRIVDHVVAHRLGRIGHHGINQRAGHAHCARRQRADLYRGPHLGDDLAARVVGGERGRVDIDVGRLLVEADVAVRIGEGAADQRHVDRKRLVAQQLAAIDFDHLGEIVLGALVHAPALKARVDERAKADVRE